MSDEMKAAWEAARQELDRVICTAMRRQLTEDETKEFQAMEMHVQSLSARLGENGRKPKTIKAKL